MPSHTYFQNESNMFIAAIDNGSSGFFVLFAGTSTGLSADKAGSMAGAEWEFVVSGSLANGMRTEAIIKTGLK